MPAEPVSREVALERFESCFHLVRWTFDRWRRGIQLSDADDWMQIGYLALWTAALNYRPEVARFATFAYWCVRNSFAEHHRTLARLKRAPRGYRKRLEDIGCLPDFSPVEIEDFERELASLSDVERRLVLDRMQGLDSVKSGAANGVSRTKVCNVLREIAARFEWPVRLTRKGNRPRSRDGKPAREGKPVVGGDENQESESDQ